PGWPSQLDAAGTSATQPFLQYCGNSKRVRRQGNRREAALQRNKRVNPPVSVSVSPPRTLTLSCCRRQTTKPFPPRHGRVWFVARVSFTAAAGATCRCQRGA
ncbi:unnamed protein product, partial [Ectocarpus sp. 12 AP-2014]